MCGFLDATFGVSAHTIRRNSNPRGSIHCPMIVEASTRASSPNRSRTSCAIWVRTTSPSAPRSTRRKRLTAWRCTSNACSAARSRRSRTRSASPKASSWRDSSSTLCPRRPQIRDRTRPTDDRRRGPPRDPRPPPRRSAGTDRRPPHPTAGHHAADERSGRATRRPPDRNGDRLRRPHRHRDGVHPPQRDPTVSPGAAPLLRGWSQPARADDVLHGIDRSTRPRGPVRPGRGGARLLRHDDHAAARQSLAVSPAVGLLHGLHRLVEPHPLRPGHGLGVERPRRRRTKPRPGRQGLGSLRELLERRRVPRLRRRRVPAPAPRRRPVTIRRPRFDQSDPRSSDAVSGAAAGAADALARAAATIATCWSPPRALERL